MITLFESIKQIINEEANGRFNNRINDINDLLNIKSDIIPSKLGDEYKNILIEFINDLVKNNNDELIFAYSLTNNYFKIPYDFYQTIKDLIKTKYSNYFTIKSDYPATSKIKIGFLDKNGKPTKEIFETGRGSKGVTTAQQERATCLVWNDFVRSMAEINNYDLNNISFIKELVKDLSDGFDKGWITTFQKQVKLITDYISSFGENYLNYRLDRAGEGTVGKAYGLYISKYSKILEGRKDNFDPSDVILFNNEKASYLINWFKSEASKISNENNALESKQRFITELFDTNLLRGISLKKISNSKNGIYEIFNKGENKVPLIKKGNYEIIHAWNNESDSKYIRIACYGDFKFDNTTTPDNNKEVAGKNKTVYLTLRSFGSSIVAIDTNLKDGPALGKCPVRIWREIINAKDTTDLKQCLMDFNKWLNSNENIEQGLTRIIQGSIKEGVLCFPFVIIH